MEKDIYESLNSFDENYFSKSFLGKTVEVKVTRPVGYVSGKTYNHSDNEKFIGYDFPEITYPINYGYINGVTMNNCETYILGIDEPVYDLIDVKVIALIMRKNGENVFISAPPDCNEKYTLSELLNQTYFIEKFYDIKNVIVYY